MLDTQSCESSVPSSDDVDSSIAAESLAMGDRLGEGSSRGTRLAKPPCAAASKSSLLEGRPPWPWRTDIRTAVLKPLGNLSRSRMMT